MSRLRDRQSKTFGSIAAIQTLVDNYPSLKNTDSIMDSVSVGTSLGYILSLLRILGVTNTDIYGWISKLLCGENLYSDDTKSKALAVTEKASNGLLDVIENAIKVVLFANIKDLFGGCPIDIMIPDWLIEEQGEGTQEHGIDSNVGLNVNIALIDTFGTLKACPCDKAGSIFYFDTVPTIYGDTYNVNDVYKSSDFNAFLWYIINKSGANGKLWDNRVNVQKDLLSDIKEEDDDNGNTVYSWPLRNEFFDEEKVTGKITADGKTIRKKRIIKCRYINTGNVTDGDGLIKVTLPAERYRLTFSNSGFYVNRTIFEFNYDYIFSLKLFDAKTLVANILNSALSLSTTIGVGVSFQKNIIKQQVSGLVNKVMLSESDDENESGDNVCFTQFSNAEFDTMLKQAELAKDGKYELGGKIIDSSEINTDEIINKVKKISESDDQKSAISDAISTASKAASNVPEISADFNFSCDVSFIYNFLQQTVTEIVMQILSPKITMLYAINAAVMGKIDDTEGWKKNFTFNSINELLARLQNLIINIIKQCLDLIIKELFKFLMDKLGPLIKLFVLQMLLETIRDYKDLILQLITACGMIPINFARLPDGTLNIDDVQYADIVPMKTTPGNNKC